MTTVYPDKKETLEDDENLSFTAEAMAIVRMACDKSSTHGAHWYNIIGDSRAKAAFLVVVFTMQSM